MIIKKLRLKLFLVISVIITLLILFSCDAKLTSPDTKDIPTNLQLEVIAEGIVELSWDYETTSEDTIEFIISKKVGDSDYLTYSINLSDDQRSFVDNEVITNDTLIYAYKIHTYNVSQDEYYGDTDPVAYFSENTIPSNLEIEQNNQNLLTISWVDNCVGEEGIFIDKKIGSGNWVNKFKTLQANTTACTDTTTLNQEIFYRASVFFKSNSSGTVSNSIVPIFSAPTNITLTKLDFDKIRVSWTGNSDDQEDGFRVERKIGDLGWNYISPNILEDPIDVTDGTSIIDDLSAYDLDCADLAYRILAYEGESTSDYSEEVSTKIRLELIGSKDTNGDAKDIFIKDYTGYIADYYSGLLILDLNNPTTPTDFATLNLPDRTHSVYTKGNKIYTLNQIGGFSIIDAIDIANPVIVDTCSIPGPLRDIYIYDYNDNPFYRFGYVSRAENGVSILNLQGAPHYDENTPTISTNGDAKKVFVPTNDTYSNYAFVANGSNNGFAVIDISDPTIHDPEVILYDQFDGNSSGQDIFVRANYLYLANGERGLDIVDISDIHSPLKVTSVETDGFVVGVYVFEEYAYIIDREKGLYVINIEEEDAPYIQGSFELDSTPSSLNFLGSYVYITDDIGIKIIQVLD